MRMGRPTSNEGCYVSSMKWLLMMWLFQLEISSQNYREGGGGRPHDFEHWGPPPPCSYSTGQRLVLYLERVSVSSTVWINPYLQADMLLLLTITWPWAKTKWQSWKWVDLFRSILVPSVRFEFIWVFKYMAISWNDVHICTNSSLLSEEEQKDANKIAGCIKDNFNQLYCEIL